MYDIEIEMKRRMDCWNERFVACWKDKFTQTELANALNERYQTKSFTQKTINRWMHLGDPHRGIKGFPAYETMLRIAGFFDVDVGYLTGETDADTFTEEKASSYLGLQTSAIKVIKNATGTDRDMSELVFERTDTVRQIFNHFLTAEMFPLFIEALAELSSVYEDPDKEKHLWKAAEKKYGKQLISEAIQHMDDNPELGDPEPRPELLEAIRAVHNIFDQGYEIQQGSELYSDLFRFRLQRSFNELIDELYPPY